MISSPRLARLMHSALSLTSTPSRSTMSFRRRHVLVLMANEPRRHFDDRYLAAKAAVDLAEFEADIAAADNDQMLRQKVDVHHRRIRQVGHFVYAGHWRHQRPAPDIDKDPFSAQPPSIVVIGGDFHRLRRREPGMAAVKRDVGGVFEGRGKPVS